MYFVLLMKNIGVIFKNIVNFNLNLFHFIYFFLKDIIGDAKTYEMDSLIFSENDACDNSSDTSEKGGIFRSLYLFKICVQCGQTNSTPLYRYCDKCYKVSSSLFIY